MFLSFFGIASIGLSCLVALFLYHVVFGIQYLGILNGVAAFVIVGIGKHVLTQNLPVLPCHISCLQERERSWWQMQIKFSSPFPPLLVSEIFADVEREIRFLACVPTVSKVSKSLLFFPRG